jgi:hypothetical protein
MELGSQCCVWCGWSLREVQHHPRVGIYVVEFDERQVLEIDLLLALVTGRKLRVEAVAKSRALHGAQNNEVVR